MENKDNQVRLRKIPLNVFIQALTEIYNNGVDYVDLIGTPDEEQDTIGIAFCDEYLSKEEEIDDTEENIDDLKEQIKNINLSDEDLNQLL
jgi:RNA recognition motif-containing protein